MARRLYVIRHGTVHNPEGVMYRRLPGFVLGEQGRAEAQRSAEFLKDVPFERFYHSPLERTIETATIVNGPHGAPMTMDERIHETDLNEDPDVVAARMRSFYQDWLAGGDQVAAMVSHRDPIRALFLSLEGRPIWPAIDDMDDFPLPPAGVYLIRPAESGATIEKLFFP